MMVRKPAVAGQFYESGRHDLENQIRECFLHKLGPGKLPASKGAHRNIVGLIVPHAGYMYSGPVAANSYYSLSSNAAPDTFIIIGPNHTGIGSSVSIMKSGKWATPLGEAHVDTEMAEKMIGASGFLTDDSSAHLMEHSIEVQLPFLQFVYKKINFVPVCMLDQSYDACVDLADSIGEAIEGRNAVVIASSDLSHYVPHDAAWQKDAKAIDVIKTLDAKKFHEAVERSGISACGYGPVTTMMLCTKRIGAKKCEVLRYATSGDITGDRLSVVGYCSAKLAK